ncbi:hypothetical protein [Nonomuraea sp. NPDC050310]|uniref:hypothetical protein n=1 Tax=Nonomuraea sp. NPDC050310 TaxID=3154935 RepID=UPI0034112815
MSVELTVWREAEPIPRERARIAYRTILAGTPGEPADPGLLALAKAFPEHATTYPDAVLVAMEPEEMDEISNRVFAEARSAGLVCYDPQRDLVHNLAPRGVYPELQLHTGDGMIVVDPDLGLVHDVLGTLSAGNPFTALVVFGSHFLQVSPGYELEYKEGLLRRTEVADLDAVRQAFDEYARGERGFLERFTWS